MIVAWINSYNCSICIDIIVCSLEPKLMVSLSRTSIPLAFCLVYVMELVKKLLCQLEYHTGELVVVVQVALAQKATAYSIIDQENGNSFNWVIVKLEKYMRAL